MSAIKDQEFLKAEITKRAGEGRVDEILERTAAKGILEKNSVLSFELGRLLGCEQGGGGSTEAAQSNPTPTAKPEPEADRSSADRHQSDSKQSKPRQELRGRERMRAAIRKNLGTGKSKEAPPTTEPNKPAQQVSKTESPQNEGATPKPTPRGRQRALDALRQDPKIKAENKRKGVA